MILLSKHKQLEVNTPKILIFKRINYARVALI